MKRSGQVSLALLVFCALTVIVMGGFATWAASFLNMSLRDFNRTLAFSIAESGIEYYRWHLAHAPTDYQDGTNDEGPYTHNYYDKSGSLIGTFTLDIVPPAVGSNVVTITSTGRLIGDPSIEKVIRVKLGISSLARYAMITNTDVRFGEGTEVFGEIFSNAGIRFDGIAHNLVQSAVPSYNDPDHGGQDEFGVHTHVSPLDPQPPTAVPSRPDVFMAGRNFPVPANDFQSITQDLADIRTSAIGAGVYATSSGVYGYDIVLNPDDTYQMYKVTALVPPPNGCTNTSNQPGWGTWSIQSETLFRSGTIPVNGIFYLEDHVWVRGSVNTARVTIASGRFPDNAATRTNITINEDITYTNHDGQDVIALIAQNNINVGLISADNLEIDAALLSQHGRVGRFYYQPPTGSTGNTSKCGPTVVRDVLTLFGMLGSNLRYGFGYTDITGYTTRNIVYDVNLLFSPPPEFPLQGNEYVQVSWEEVQ